MRIATWNVNSVRARHDRLLAWLAANPVDILCLQEIKVTADDFPFDAVTGAGYHASVFGQKTYNGVAILSRIAASEVTTGFGDGVDDPQARFLSARIGGVTIASVYVPNGQTVGSDKWQYKLAWLQRLRAWLDRRDPEEPVILAGDFNVAPDERDVRFPERWIDSVLYHPEAREALAGVTGFGLEDVFRRHHTEGGLYSWWDYRMLGFPKDDGLRIDLILANAAQSARATSARIDRNERKGKQPSDHAPVLVDFTDA